MANAFVRIGVAVCAVLACGSVVRAADDDNPVYKSWASHAVGTQVTIRITVEVKGKDKSVSESVQALKSMDADKVVLSDRVTVEAKPSGRAVPRDRTIPAKKSVRPPDATAKISEDTLKIGDKTYKCKLTEETTATPDTRIQFKYWTSLEVPGHLVKSETVVEGNSNSKIVKEIIEVVEK